MFTKIACRVFLGIVTWLVLIPSTRGADRSITRPTEGLREYQPRVDALIGARLVIGAGRELPVGTIVLRDGQITAMGATVEIPADAHRWELPGRVIYPGFIDAYGEVAMAELPTDRAAAHWSRSIQPQREVVANWQADAGQQKSYRQQGIVARLLAPNDGIMKGASLLALTGDRRTDELIVNRHVAQHMRFAVPRNTDRDQFPGSPMGAVALARQTLYDAQWYRDAWRLYDAQSHPDVPRPELNDALQALQRVITGEEPVMVDVPDDQYLLRADRILREFGLRAIIVGSGQEYRQLEAIRATGWPIVVPLNFPLAPNVASPESAMDVSLEQLMVWDLSPENPGRLQRAGVRIALTAHGLKQPSDFLAAVRRAVRRGLAPEEALRALTETPAALHGVSARMGTLEVGKGAHLIVADGDLFTNDASKVIETWVAGDRYPADNGVTVDPRGRWTVMTDDPTQQRELIIEGTPAAPQVEWLVKEKPNERVRWNHVDWNGSQLTGDFPAKSWGGEGLARGSLTWITTPDAKVAPLWTGQVVLAEGRSMSLTSQRSEVTAAKDTPAATPSTNTIRDLRASFVVNHPLGDYGRAGPPEQPESILYRQATVWTCGEQGVLPRADVLVRRGEIAQVAPTIDAIPPGTRIIELEGRHLTPGIIDCHSHMATDGGVNEATQAVTAEVRIGDFIDARDIDIYRQLAGGVTTANILHGSANPIGGQNQVIKLRWGATSEGLKFTEAPAGIKFALGENVKQSNWGERFQSRYPQTRMGVEQIVRDALLAARQYRDRQLAWKSNPRGLPPRRDLELDALVEVLDQQRWIHCHSYRQDEILALLRTMESLHVQIGTLQHILEGYKVADAIQKHGAMASSFSDWWAYKIEVYDAIPFNGAILHQQGVVVSFNSDDAELARHLNQEAGKAVKYGGVPEAEALKFVTLNPARQLRIDRWVGSIETGKQADLVVWNGPPLSPTSRCEQTWIEGRLYFDRDQDRIARDTLRTMRSHLVQKVLTLQSPMEDAARVEKQERDLWPRTDLFCTRRSRGR